MMKKMKLLALASLTLGVFAGTPLAAGMLGVSTYAATNIVNAIMAGMSIWSIIGLFAVSGGAMAVVFAGVKRLISTIGKKAAVAW